ncbi:hypothetical protein [Anaerostipes sp. Marseille-Q3525]|uniref:hypothetical protein n=1 Tax=Anaerostipes sp. Marseille-Q3525 TaxID=2758418 RepID=UPI001BA8314B|nr:hypothetical protein [Anaerostipes sp. Marseille-Q3525]MBR9960875.1 hypothetical protein [Anaerostipes sp. Marseille-Q3525]
MENKTRLIILSDSPGMDGELVIFRTNVPAKRLKALEVESCNAYTNDTDIPIWVEVLEKEGYVCDIVDCHSHVTPYETSFEWKAKCYPYITECYDIDNVISLINGSEEKRIANILFNMSLDMDYDSSVDDYREDMEMLTESVGKLSKEDDPLYYVLQNIAGNNEEMENKLVNADGSICR